MTDILILKGPPMVTGKRGVSVQVHATAKGANPMAVELMPEKARGVAQVLDTVGESSLASQLRSAADFVEGRDG